MPGLITLTVECIACDEVVPRTKASQWAFTNGAGWVCDGCWVACDTCGNRVPTCTVVDDYYHSWEHPGGEHLYCQACTLADLESTDPPYLYLVHR